MLSKVSELFNVEYGNKFDANKLLFVDDGVNFVSRTNKNLGIGGQVEPVEGATLHSAGLITVTHVRISGDLQHGTAFFTVHDLDAAFDQRGDKRLTLSVGQAQEHHVEFCLKNGVGRFHREVGVDTG